MTKLKHGTHLKNVGSYEPCADREIHELARGIVTGQVFTDMFIDDVDELFAIFPFLGVMGHGDWFRLHKKEIALIYCMMDKALDDKKTDNGNPVLATVLWLDRSDFMRLMAELVTIKKIGLDEYLQKY